MADITGFIADLSHYNTGVDLAAMRAGGIAAVILKTSQGATFTDPAFASRAVAARSAGLLVGAYHYYATGVDPIAQANYFLGIARAAEVSVLAVDFEPSAAGTDEENAATMCQALHDATGRWPLLYTGKWNVAPANPIFSSCPLWIAEWTTAAAPNLPPGFASWQMWQYESKLNAVPGVAGVCDHSRFNGDLAALEEWWTGSAPPTETILDTIVDGSGRTHQIIDRILSTVVSASPATLRCSLAAVVGALALTLCPAPTRDPPTRAEITREWLRATSTFRFDRAADGRLHVVHMGE